jgi:hypothetical protein
VTTGVFMVPREDFVSHFSVLLEGAPYEAWVLALDKDGQWRPG